MQEVATLFILSDIEILFPGEGVKNTTKLIFHYLKNLSTKFKSWFGKSKCVYIFCFWTKEKNFESILVNILHSEFYKKLKFMLVLIFVVILQSN